LALQAWRKKPGAEPQLLSLEQQRAELTTVEVLRLLGLSSEEVHVLPQHCQLIILGQKRSLGLLLEKEVEQIFCP